MLFVFPIAEDNCKLLFWFWLSCVLISGFGGLDIKTGSEHKTVTRCQFYSSVKSTFPIQKLNNCFGRQNFP